MLTRSASLIMILAVISLGRPWIGRADGPYPPYSEIRGYTPVFRPYTGPDGKLRIAIREFRAGRSKKLLSLDPDTFATEVVEAVAAGGRDVLGNDWEDTPFYRAVLAYTETEGGMGAKNPEMSGITRGPADSGGVYLTVDLCPTKKGLDRAVFEVSQGLMRPRGAPLPIAIAVSGLWIRGHAKDLDWLKEEIKAGRLDVTWVNHSYSHPYRRGRPEEKNFLLTPGIDFRKEVLGAEIEMLSSGITPQPFFRFPGLAADARLLSGLRGLSLIPVAADAWPARGGAPSSGSIILVHGNGNEPEGPAWLASFYEERRHEIEEGKLRPLPIRDAFNGR
jgi:hypothetical protein